MKADCKYCAYYTVCDKCRDCKDTDCENCDYYKDCDKPESCKEKFNEKWLSKKYY